MITFKYNGKQYTTNNLQNKLNKLGISESDIELMGQKQESEIDTSIKLYKWYNKKTKGSLYSIYKELNTDYYNEEDWTFVE